MAMEVSEARPDGWVLPWEPDELGPCEPEALQLLAVEADPQRWLEDRPGSESGATEQSSGPCLPTTTAPQPCAQQVLPAPTERPGLSRNVVDASGRGRPKARGRQKAASTPRGSTAAARPMRSRTAERGMRREQLEKLDSFIPAHLICNAQANCAGGRSVGAGGRTLNDVLHDVVCYVRELRAESQALPASAQQQSYPARLPCPSSNGKLVLGQTASCASLVAPGMVSGEELRASLWNCDNILCAEVEIRGDEEGWIVRDYGVCAQRMWGGAPWGANSKGRPLMSLVDPADYGMLVDFWRRCGGLDVHSPDSDEAIIATSHLAHLKVFGPYTSEGSEPYDLRLLPIRSACDAAATRRMLIFGTPPPFETPSLFSIQPSSPATSALSTSSSTKTLPCSNFLRDEPNPLVMEIQVCHAICNKRT